LALFDPEYVLEDISKNEFFSHSNGIDVNIIRIEQFSWWENGY
jgi:hypothetical protein